MGGLWLPLGRGGLKGWSRFCLHIKENQVSHVGATTTSLHLNWYKAFKMPWLLFWAQIKNTKPYHQEVRVTPRSYNHNRVCLMRVAPVFIMDQRKTSDGDSCKPHGLTFYQARARSQQERKPTCKQKVLHVLNHKFSQSHTLLLQPLQNATWKICCQL